METPEAVILELQPAGPVIRAVAWLLDLVIRAVVLVVFAIVAVPFGGVGQGVWLIVVFGISFVYPALFEALNDGATPGKRAFGLCVVKSDGTPVDLSAAVTRNLLRTADWFPALNVLGLVTIVSSRSFQRLGDLAAGTVVVYRRRSSAISSIRTSELADARPVAPATPLEPDEQRVIGQFTERVVVLGRARSAELAALVAPGLVRRQTADPLQTVYGVAAWIASGDEDAT